MPLFTEYSLISQTLLWALGIWIKIFALMKPRFRGRKQTINKQRQSRSDTFKC